MLSELRGNLSRNGRSMQLNSSHDRGEHHHTATTAMPACLRDSNRTMHCHQGVQRLSRELCSTHAGASLSSV